MMSEKLWAWVIWVIGLLLLILLAIPSLGFTVILIWAWWVGGPLYISKDGEVAPFWQPMKPRKLWWRDIR
jgi:hypothetical protein